MTTLNIFFQAKFVIWVHFSDCSSFKTSSYFWSIEKRVANASMHWCKNEHKPLCKTRNLWTMQPRQRLNITRNEHAAHDSADIYQSRAESWGQRTKPAEWHWFPQRQRTAWGCVWPCPQCSSPRTGTSWSGRASRQSILGPSACGRWPRGAAASPCREATFRLKEWYGVVESGKRHAVRTMLKVRTGVDKSRWTPSVGFRRHVLTGDLHHLFSDFQQDGDADVVLSHHAVQHGLGAFRVRHGQLVELHRVLLHRAEPSQTHGGGGRGGDVLVWLQKAAAITFRYK